MGIAFPVACPEMVCCRFVVMDKCARILLKDFNPAKRFKVFFCTAAVKHIILCAEISYVCLGPVCCHNGCIRAYFPGIEYGIPDYRPQICAGIPKAAAEIIDAAGGNSKGIPRQGINKRADPAVRNGPFAV